MNPNLSFSFAATPGSDDSQVSKSRPGPAWGNSVKRERNSTLDYPERGEVKMKRLVSYFSVLILATQTATTCAQMTEKPRPGFTLTISGDTDANRRGVYVLAVIETNISNKAIREGGCLPLAFRAGISISVEYNGVPLEMDETKPMVLNLRKHQKHPVPCNGSMFSHEAQPGGGPEGAFEDNLPLSTLYDMSKPGRYEITVSKETFPHDPERSVIVKSNTLTIVVPEPEVSAPN